MATKNNRGIEPQGNEEYLKHRQPDGNEVFLQKNELTAENRGQDPKGNQNFVTGRQPDGNVNFLQPGELRRDTNENITPTGDNNSSQEKKIELVSEYYHNKENEENEENEEKLERMLEEKLDRIEQKENIEEVHEELQEKVHEKALKKEFDALGELKYNDTIDYYNKALKFNAENKTDFEITTEKVLSVASKITKNRLEKISNLANSSRKRKRTDHSSNRPEEPIKKRTRKSRGM